LNHPERLRRILGELDLIAEKFEVLFPVHPHTKKKLEEDPSLNPIRVSFIKPMGYLHFINLIRKAMMVITDSGGVQEETTYLGIPCLTVRDNTERPITISEGTNQLVKPEDLSRTFFQYQPKDYKVPEYWDGKTAARIITILRKERLL
jgi:UDP-N-acetylglucosamine 2-epimerase (non-hydrolysing)